MQNAEISPQIAPDWRSASHWVHNARPAALWPLLTHAGSLTEKLRALAGPQFHVQVLRETRVRLIAEDAKCLGVDTGAQAWQREVYLCSGAPLVYARTLARMAGDAPRWLEGLGTQPLGERVFAQPGVERGPIEVACLFPHQPLYQAAVAGLAGTLPARVWARRSRLVAAAVPLLIYECFLNEGMA